MGFGAKSNRQKCIELSENSSRDSDSQKLRQGGCSLIISLAFSIKFCWHKVTQQRETIDKLFLVRQRLKAMQWGKVEHFSYSVLMMSSYYRYIH